MTIRTRFAPSPTGYLHIGGARTALFCWLFARKHGGSFILRVEDTDLERSSTGAVNVILESLAWLGLEFDEGPFFQTERFDRYQATIDRLLDEGKAYRCDCPRERLDKLRAEQMARKAKPKYDGHCRHRQIDPSQPHVVRFVNPDSGDVLVEDLIHGTVRFNNAELDDLVIRKSDGSPTYNLAVVVDDLDMGITHVIRGDDHLSNTPRQVNIFKALGAPVPKFAHVALILGDDGQKLSKRHGAVSVLQYRDDGFLPEAVLNYLVRLGWSHGDQEIFSLDEMIRLFDLEQINKSASAFNTSKLLWLNQQYMMKTPPEHLARHLSHHFGELGIDPSDGAELSEVAREMAPRVHTLKELAQLSTFFYRDPEDFEPAAAKKHLRPVALEPLEHSLDALAALADWTPEAIHALVAEIAERLGVGMGKIAQPLRVAVSGRAATPGIDVTLHLVGRDACLRRIEKAIEFVRARAENS